MMSFTSEQAALLLRNKFVIIMGDSNQRSVYKDLVLFLQKDTYLTDAQLRSKCEQSFEGDRLLGSSERCNRTEFWESRQLCLPHHLLRFHFLTRAYNPHLERLLQELLTGPSPDVLVISSCLWDINRYGKDWRTDYSSRLHQLFSCLRQMLHPDCLVIWSLALPLGKNPKGGILNPQLQGKEVLEANLRAAVIANYYNLDVLDLHFHFRHRPKLRAPDDVHWKRKAHRILTHTLLRHIAQAWGVRVPGHPPPTDSSLWDVGGRNCVVFGQNSPVLTYLPPEQPERSPGLTRGPPQLTGRSVRAAEPESPHRVRRLVHSGLVDRHRLTHRHFQPYGRDPQRRRRERLGPGDGTDRGGRSGGDGSDRRFTMSGGDRIGLVWSGSRVTAGRGRSGGEGSDGHCEWRGPHGLDGHFVLGREWGGHGGTGQEGPGWAGGSLRAGLDGHW